MPSSIPKPRKAVLCLVEKILVLDLHSGASYSALGRECNVNRSVVDMK